jgi:hypothetical protein
MKTENKNVTKLREARSAKMKEPQPPFPSMAEVLYAISGKAPRAVARPDHNVEEYD